MCSDAVGASQAPHPYFLIYDRATMKREEGRLVQVMPVPLAEFKGTASANDETLLRQQADYEIQFWHPRHSSSRLTSLTNGRAALLWSLTIAKKLPAGNEQLYLSLRQNDYVLVLSSNLPPGRDRKQMENYLLRVGASFRASAHPLPTPPPPKVRS